MSIWNKITAPYHELNWRFQAWRSKKVQRRVLRELTKVSEATRIQLVAWTGLLGADLDRALDALAAHRPALVDAHIVVGWARWRITDAGRAALEGK